MTRHPARRPKTVEELRREASALAEAITLTPDQAEALSKQLEAIYAQILEWRRERLAAQEAAE